MRAVPKQRIAALPYVGSLWRGTRRDEARFCNEVRAIVGGEGVHCVPLGRARTGVYLLVRWAVRGGRTKVILSPCTIPDVVNMVRLAGGEPVFVDYLPHSTNIDLDQLDDLLDDCTACVIATHYHVSQTAIPLIRSLCANRGVLLFEDCAIAFGAVMEGKPVGAQTDASVFSFSAFKFLNFFWGGLITTRDSKLADWLRAETAAWRRLAYRDYLLHAKNITIYDLATRPGIFQAFTFPRLQQRAKVSSAPVELPYQRIENRTLDETLVTRPSYAAFAHWRGRLQRVQEQIVRRRRIAAIYRQRLGSFMVSAETGAEVVNGSCFVNFPIWVGSLNQSALHRDAMIAGFDLGQSLYPNVHDLDAFQNCPGVSTQAQRLVQSTVYLPTHPGVPFAYAEQLSEAVGGLLQRYATAKAMIAAAE